VKWVFEHFGPTYDEDKAIVFAAAAENGNLNNMKWLRYVAHLEVLKVKRLYVWDSKTFISAAKNGNLDNMKCLKENDCPYDAGAFTAALEKGLFLNIMWMLEKNFLCDEKSFEAAAKYEHFEVMKILKSRNCPWDVRTSRAAINGARKQNNHNYVMIHWLKAEGCPFDDDVVIE
jgi:hypothetical protein